MAPNANDSIPAISTLQYRDPSDQSIVQSDGSRTQICHFPLAVQQAKKPWRSLYRPKTEWSLKSSSSQEYCFNPGELAIFKEQYIYQGRESRLFETMQSLGFSSYDILDGASIWYLEESLGNAIFMAQIDFVDATLPNLAHNVTGMAKSEWKVAVCQRPSNCARDCESVEAIRSIVDDRLSRYADFVSASPTVGYTLSADTE
ncbi:hypothetical protein NX059_005554 [Plenodomus lindquistii]|nr:hypothetical protein NX059_005554 [Plenodomus lindquistii]